MADIDHGISFNSVGVEHVLFASSVANLLREDLHRMRVNDYSKITLTPKFMIQPKSTIMQANGILTLSNF